MSTQTAVAERDAVLAQLMAIGAEPVAAVLRRLTEEEPDRTVLTLIREDGEVSHATRQELNDLATRMARVLSSHGVDDRGAVAGCLPNSVELVALAFATWRLGAAFLPVNPKMPAFERDGVLDLQDPTVTVHDVDEDLGRPAVRLAEFLDASARESSEPLEDRVAWPGKMIASGGSTGRSKIIVTPWPWMHLREWGEPTNNEIGVRPGMRHLVSGPIYHNWQFDQCFHPIMNGGSVVMLDRFDARRAVDAVRDYRVEYAALVPTTMRRIAHLDGLDPADLRSLEAICHTAAPCPPAIKREWIDLIGAERVYELYGAAESIGLCVIRGDEWLTRPGTVGRPVACEVRILSDDGETLPPGELGAIFLRKPATDPTGEYRGAEPLHRTDDGFVTVGDLGWVDDDGFLYLADRRKDLIITGGVNVYPAEVEAVLADHPKIAEAIVVGIDDEEWGKRVHAIVEPRAGAMLDAEEVRAFCRARLQPAKVPKTLEFVTEIPRSDAGKARRTQLGTNRSA